MRTIAFVTQKGGSGKSTLCINLSIAAQEAALRAAAETAVATAPGAASAPRVANAPVGFGTAPGVGTPPGVGLGQKPPVYLNVGDEMRLGIQGLGEQRQRVIAYR